jgi:hypothetical protein
MQVCTGLVPRRLRRRFLDNPVAKWLVPECRCIALPEADRRKRFFVALCVLTFVLDLFLFIGRLVDRQITKRPRTPTGVTDHIAQPSTAEGRTRQFFIEDRPEKTPRPLESASFPPSNRRSPCRE